MNSAHRPSSPSAPAPLFFHLRLLLLCGCALLGSSCESLCRMHNAWNLTALPAEIPLGSSPDAVLHRMGPRDGVSDWVYDPSHGPAGYQGMAPPCNCPAGRHCQPDCRAQNACQCVSPRAGEIVGKVWHYRDLWHRQSCPELWASWDLYFDLTDHYAGWRLVEPTGSEPVARQSFIQDPSPALKIRQEMDEALYRFQRSLCNLHPELQDLRGACNQLQDALRAHLPGLEPELQPAMLAMRENCNEFEREALAQKPTVPAAWLLTAQSCLFQVSSCAREALRWQTHTVGHIKTCPGFKECMDAAPPVTTTPVSRK